jgi:TfoX/Sxy family transcriptional regulator of competence genes
MSVSPSFRTFVLEQLSRLDPLVRARCMFGGVGVDTVDDSNRPDFVARGMRPCKPGVPAGETMQYYEVPPDLLEDAEGLRNAFTPLARSAEGR